MLATIATARQRNRQAETYLRQALELKPDSLDALDRLGMLLANRMQTGEAIRLLHTAVRLSPVEDRARANLGNAAFALMLPSLMLMGLIGAALWGLLTAAGVDFVTALLAGFWTVLMSSVWLHKYRPKSTVPGSPFLSGCP